MRQTHIKNIRAKCIEANPDILKLEFGCKIKTNKFYSEGVEWICGTDHGERVGFYLSLRGNQLIYASEITEIIGRDIRLYDIMRACTAKEGDMSNEDYRKMIYEIWTSWGSTDNLEDQSDETLEFINNLLQ